MNFIASIILLAQESPASAQSLDVWPIAAVLTFVIALVALVFWGKIPLAYNVRNLIVRWPTTLVTALAFTLVIALQTVLLGFVAGMNKLTDNSGQPGNVIVLSDGALDEQMSNISVENSTGILLQGLVKTDPSGQPMASREVYVVVNQPIPRKEGQPERRRMTQLRGIEDPRIAAEVHALELLPGSSWFSDAGAQLAKIDGQEVEVVQAVLGEGVAGQLGKDYGKESLVVGDTFVLGPRTWIVTGIMKSAGSTYGSEIWAKRPIVGPMFGKETYSSFVLRTAGAAEAAALSKDLNTNYKQVAIKTQPESEYFSKLAETNKQLSVAIWIVTIMMAAGGAFGVMNTMFAATAARTKDIGMLRIIGYARWQILVSFLVESVAIAIAGGLLGCLLGFLANGMTATSIVSGANGAGGKFVVLEIVIGANTLLAGLILSLVMGAAGGILPAVFAMVNRPLESLR